tara:strand:+ start:4063 stop:5241 length:1179 start_codon:yes stop_codon:yes gene_type:complete
MIYGYHHFADTSDDNREEIACLRLLIEHTGYENLGGMLFLLSRHNLSSHFIKLCEELKERGLEIIIGFHVYHPRERKHRKHMRFAREVSKITKKIALASHGILEWVGRAPKAEIYKQMADDNGFEWICTVTHKTLCIDYKSNWALRNFLAEKKIFCVCLCGYVLAGYLYDDLTIPHLWGTTLRYRNLHQEFGLEIRRFSKYLKPLNIFSGAGGPEGLYAGSQVYCKRLNFKGTVASLPFDIRGSEGMRVNEEPLFYPESCGPPESNRYDISRFPSGVVPKDQIITFGFNSCFKEEFFFSKSFKFSKPFINRVIREHYRSGYKTILVTSHPQDEVSNIWHHMSHYGLPVQHIYYTGGELKGPILKKINSTLHYDADDKQIESARAHDIEAIKI